MKKTNANKITHINLDGENVTLAEAKKRMRELGKTLAKLGKVIKNAEKKAGK